MKDKLTEIEGGFNDHGLVLTVLNAMNILIRDYNERNGEGQPCIVCGELVDGDLRICRSHVVGLAAPSSGNEEHDLPYCNNQQCKCLDEEGNYRVTEAGTCKCHKREPKGWQVKVVSVTAPDKSDEEVDSGIVAGNYPTFSAPASSTKEEHHTIEEIIALIDKVSEDMDTISRISREIRNKLPLL